MVDHSHRGGSDTEASPDSTVAYTSLGGDPHSHKLSHHEMGPVAGVAVDFDGSLEKVGFGAFQYFLLAICGFGWMTDNLVIGTIPLVIPQLHSLWDLSKATQGLMATCSFTGMALGSLVWGWIGDRYGRKPAFFGTVLCTSTAAVVTALSVNVYMFAVMVFLTGFGVGGNLPLDGIMISEFVHKDKRGEILSLLSTCWALGSLLAAIVAYVTIPWMSLEMGWRMMYFVIAAVNLMLILGRRGIPESPRWLLSQGRNEEALAILKHIATVNGCEDVSKIEFVEQQTGESDIEETTSLVGTQGVADKGSLGNLAYLRQLLRDLFSRSHYLYLITPLLWYVWGMTAYSYSAFNVFLPTLMESKGIKDNSSLYESTVIYSAAALPGSIVAAYLVGTFLGRRYTMLMSILVNGACIYVFALVSTKDMLTTVAAIQQFFAAVMFSAIYTYTPEAYPTSIRSSAVGICSGMAKGFSLISAAMFGVFLEDIDGSLIAMAVIMGSCSVAVWCLPIETRGRALAETL
eukprot:GFYU01005894.1.p1 GENE.GFYU01005894.1~~GFYU01005894.1.p1  ORF type:complete len:517 (+),score=126.48 GFYU01005894.1:199-1749(+)